MKEIAKTLGMDDLDMDSVYDIGVNETSVASKTKHDLTVPTDEELPIPSINDRLEDSLINEGYDEVQKIIRHALSHGIQIADLAKDVDPQYRARLLEVGADFFKTALAGVKQKQDQAFKAKEHKFKRATTGIPSQVSNTQVNNYYGSRDEIMEMIENGTISEVDTEGNNDDQNDS
ncbi:hypothetical protein CL653_03195 [bacterium]|nr:hypothetical protein [bacterium]